MQATRVIQCSRDDVRHLLRMLWLTAVERYRTPTRATHLHVGNLGLHRGPLSGLLLQ